MGSSRFIPIEGFEEILTSGGDAITRYLRPALEYVCTASLQNSIATSIGSELSDDKGGAYRDWVNSLCHPLNPSAPQIFPEPSLPFDGGQCDRVPYRVNYTLDRHDGTPKVPQIFNAYGPIGLKRNPPDSSGDIGVLLTGKTGPGGYVEQVINVLKKTLSPGESQQTYTIDSVTRTDGSPDSCGNPGNSFVPSAITSPPAKTINLPSVGFSPPRISLPISLPILNIPKGLINPTLNLNIGSINLAFDFGGVHISPKVNLNFPISLPGNGGTSVAPPPGNADSNPVAPPTLDLAPVLDSIKDLEYCLCPSTREVLIPIPLGSGDSGTYALPDKTRIVKISLFQVPQTPKSIAGVNGPNVYFAGWAWFRSGGSNFTREPIDAIEKYYALPQRANGFSFTCQNGYKAIVIAYHG